MPHTSECDKIHYSGTTRSNLCNEEMLKSNEKTQIESHCIDNVSYNGNKDNQVTKDIIQEQPDVPFANEEMLKGMKKQEQNLTTQIT